MRSKHCTCDIDHIAVERAITGQHPLPTLNHCERRIVVAALTEQGYSSRDIGPMTGINPRTVVRIRSQLGRREAVAS